MYCGWRSRAPTRARSEKSDGTVVIEGRRFEIPNRYRHLTRIEVRYASWDLGHIHLVDERTGSVLARTLSAGQDAERQWFAPRARSGLDRIGQTGAHAGCVPDPTVPPLLARMLDKQATTGPASPYPAQGRSHHRRRRDVMTKKLLALYGLEVELHSRPMCRSRRCTCRAASKSFCWRAEQLVGEGGFAPGDRSARNRQVGDVLRGLAERLGAQRDVQVGILTGAASRPSGLLS